MILPRGSQIFLAEFEDYCEKLASQWSRLLRKAGSVTPKVPNSEPRVSRYSSWSKYLCAIILHYYLPEETEVDQAFKWYIRLDLERQVSKWGVENKIVALTILDSKPQMVLYLLESSYIARNPRELFGLLGKQGREIVRSTLVFWREPRKPRIQNRIRGYRDHGSLRPQHQWLEKYSKTVSSYLEQEEIERQRKAHEDTADLLKGGSS